MTQKTFSALVSKEIGGSLTRTEREELHRSLSENRKLKEVYDEIHAFMRDEKQTKTDIDAKLNEVWHKINITSQEQYSITPAKKRMVPLWARIAATVAILIWLGLLAYNYLSQQNLYSETLQAGNENLYAVLDDGTQVWLQKNARIDYNKNFGERNRKILLTGEAFFDVARNADVPLTVSANRVDVTVKGTAFNINAWDSDVEVALVRGLVGVRDMRQKNASEVLLHPNQKIVLANGKTSVNENNYQITQTNDTIVPETRWLNDALVFNKQRFADIAKLMESRYRVTIDIQNAALGEQQFTGSIKTETLPQMLEALKQSFPFTYEIEDNNVTIK